MMTAATTDSASAQRQAVQGLVLRARNGDEHAFAELVDAFEERLQRYLAVRGFSGPDADDIVQQSFVRAWQALDRYDPKWAFSTWLYTIAARLAANWRRDRKRLVTMEATPERGAVQDPGAHLDAVGPLWALARAQLKERDFHILWLHYGDDLDHDEIARVLDMKAGNVRVILHRTRKKLADLAAQSGSFSEA